MKPNAVDSKISASLDKGKTEPMMEIVQQVLVSVDHGSARSPQYSELLSNAPTPWIFGNSTSPTKLHHIIAMTDNEERGC